MQVAAPPKRTRESDNDVKNTSLCGEVVETLLPYIIGLGTHTLKGAECRSAVSSALAAGLRMIDTASVYGNEEDVGVAISSSGIPRNELFVISKASPKEMQRGYVGVMEACANSLRRLNLTFLDLYLLHWPGVAGERPESERHAALRRECWSAMTQLQKEGRCRHVGVSNFFPRHLVDLTTAVRSNGPTKGETAAVVDDDCDGSCAPVFLNQLELHPLCRQSAVTTHCREHGILVQQYSPLAKCDPRLLNHPVLQSVVDDYAEYRKRQADESLPDLGKADWCVLWGLTAGGFSSLVVRTTKPERAARLAALERLLMASHQRLENLPSVMSTLLQRIHLHLRTPMAPEATWHELTDALSADGDGATSDIHTCWFSEGVR